MPVYNAERFLREAIDSILAQSFKPFEFLIIDDGSTDSSAEIVESYKDERIRFIRNERNLGITPTLNKGIALASCELVARMDADDISHPQRLQKQYVYMKRNPRTAMLSTWARVITEDKRLIRLERYRSNFYYYNLTFECWIYHPTIMFRKSAVEAIGMYRMPYSEDYDLFWRMSTRFPISNLAEPLVDYRISPTSLNGVLKKEEYDRANEANVLRNIRHYMGEHFTLPYPVLECLRHNFNPVLSKYDIRTVLEALGVLDEITARILETENANRDVRSIRRARYFKRKFILTEVSKSLKPTQGILLLLRTGAWMTLITVLKGIVKLRIKETIKGFRNHNEGTATIYNSPVVKNT